MYLEIVSPEATLFSQEVESVAVPGALGEFQILNNHAPIVSVLDKGNIKIQGANITIPAEVSNNFKNEGGKYLLAIKSGTIELKDNKVVILAD